VSKDWDPDSLFEVFGDGLVRQILVVADKEPVSAETIVEHADASLPTVYRRLNTLEELDLLQQQTRVDGDGTQYQEYETRLQRVSFEIEDRGFDIDVRVRSDISDQFEAFWDELDRVSQGESGAASDDDIRGDSQHG
jgi:DNA-binding transcriptional ArsR family regulator